MPSDFRPDLIGEHQIIRTRVCSEPRTGVFRNETDRGNIKQNYMQRHRCAEQQSYRYRVFLSQKQPLRDASAHLEFIRTGESEVIHGNEYERNDIEQCKN